MKRRVFLASGLVLGSAGCLGIPTREPGTDDPAATSSPSSTTNTDTEPTSTVSEPTTRTPDRSPAERYTYRTGQIEDVLETVSTATLDRHPFRDSGLATTELTETVRGAENVLTRLEMDHPEQYETDELAGYLRVAKGARYLLTALATLDRFAADWHAAEDAMADRDYTAAKAAFDYERMAVSDAIEADISNARSLLASGERRFTRSEAGALMDTVATVREKALAISEEHRIYRDTTVAFNALLTVSERYQRYYTEYESTGMMPEPFPMPDAVGDIGTYYPDEKRRDGPAFLDYRRVADQIWPFAEHVRDAVRQYHGRSDGPTDAKAGFRLAETIHTDANLDRFFDYAFPNRMYD